MGTRGRWRLGLGVVAVAVAGCTAPRTQAVPAVQEAKGYVDKRDERSGVRITSVVHSGMFAKRYGLRPADVDTLSPDELPRSLRNLETALRRYPPELLRRHLLAIYLVKRLRCHGAELAGMSGWNVIYLCNDGLANGYDDAFLRENVHHEISHVLLQRNMPLLDTKAWLASNPRGFEYGKGWKQAIREGKANHNGSERLYARGFLSQYSLSAPEEDFAVLVGHLFSGDRRFWRAVDRHPALAKKVDLAVRFYQLLDPGFTRSYFRTLPPSGEKPRLAKRE